MNEFERKCIEKEFRAFTQKNFEKPRKCKNSEQIRFYVRELCLKIEDLKNKFNYVPQSAYLLLSEYNTLQNKMVFRDFQRSY